MGRFVIVEYLGENVDVNVEAIVRKDLIYYTDATMIKICRKQLKLEPGFDMVLVTSMARPKFGLNLTNHLNLVNFFISQDGLHENLLAMVVANERPDLQSDLSESSETAFTHIQELKDLEN